MREIKFRAWIKPQKTMRNILSINFEEKTVWIDLFEDMNLSYRSFDFDDVEIMQYTGLKDKNGKELYEGDIYDLKIGNKVYYRGYIRILDTYSGFRHKTIKTERVHLYKYGPCGNKFEIIGNIYENPELLNK